MLYNLALYIFHCTLNISRLSLWIIQLPPKG